VQDNIVLLMFFWISSSELLLLGPNSCIADKSNRDIHLFSWGLFNQVFIQLLPAQSSIVGFRVKLESCNDVEVHKINMLATKRTRTKESDCIKVLYIIVLRQTGSKLNVWISVQELTLKCSTISLKKKFSSILIDYPCVWAQ
jgi:hypothetical protein